MANKVALSLGYKPREWQRQCHRERERFTVLALHRRAGKTEMAIMELINSAVACTKELGMFLYVAPFLKQAKLIAWERLKQKVAPLIVHGAVEISEGELSVTFTHNGATVRCYGADNPDAMRGVRIDGVVIDEVAQVKPEVWVDIIQPACSDRMGWAMFIGTPNGVNLFSELFYKAQETSGWMARLFTVFDTEAIERDEIERLRRDMTDTSFAREYLCDFTAAGDNQLISLSDVEAAAHRVYVERDVIESARVVGVDPARFGDDRSVIVKRQGLQMFDPLIYRGMSTMDLASRVAAVITDWQPDGVFIDIGMGAGVIDRLRQLGYNVMEIAFGGKATLDKLYNNRRSEMWWAVKEWLEAKGAIPNLLPLKQELATPIYWLDPQGRRCLEEKKDIKKRLQGGKSPDIGDALALTFASPVRRPPRYGDVPPPLPQHRVRDEADPLAGF